MHEFHGYLLAAAANDYSAGQEIPIYPMGSSTAHTLGDNEYIHIKGVIMEHEDGGTIVTLTFGSSVAAGTRIIKTKQGVVAASGFTHHHHTFPTRRVGAPGTKLYAHITANKDVNIFIQGYIKGA